jgi:hypothetical protein
LATADSSTANVPPTVSDVTTTSARINGVPRASTATAAVGTNWSEVLSETRPQKQQTPPSQPQRIQPPQEVAVRDSSSSSISSSIISGSIGSIRRNHKADLKVRSCSLAVANVYPLQVACMWFCGTVNHGSTVAESM